MAAPSPGPHEVGADPREDRKGKGCGTGPRPPFPVQRGHTPIQALEGSSTGRGPGHAPHGAAGMEGEVWRVSPENFLGFLIAGEKAPPS